MLDDKVIAALVGVVVGFILNRLAEWWRDRARRRSHWAALSAEMEYCRNLADTYLRDGILAPLYRLPTVAYANSLPALLAAAGLNETDTRNLLTFFNEVETLNRGFDQIEAARLVADPEERKKRLEEEYGRNRMKAEKLIPSASHSHYDGAKSVIDSRLRWHRL